MPIFTDIIDKCGCKLHHLVASVAHFRRYLLNGEYNYETVYLTLGDLLSPIDGKITKTQLTVISRIIDIEQAENVDIKSRFLWQEKVCKAFDYKKYVSRNHFEWVSYFQGLLDSLDYYGHITNVSSFTAIRDPLTPFTCTHRLAWFVVNRSKDYIPVRVVESTLDPEFFDGKKCFNNKGFSKKDLGILATKYKQIKKSLDSDLCCLICSKFLNGSIISLIKESGDCKIHQNVTISVFDFEHEQFFSPHLKKFKQFYSGEEMTYVTIRLKKQHLYLRGARVYSKYVDRLSKKISRFLYTEKWGYIAATIAESKEMECLFDLKGFSQ